MDMKSLGLSLTNRCNASCEMCCFQCGPRGSYVIDEDVAKRYIDEAAEMGSVRALYFSGGEPLLYPHVLKSLIGYAFTEYGIPSAVVTNGFWGANAQWGAALMKELVECGLASVRISADLYHQRFVPADAVRGAIRIAYDLGILGHVTVMDVKGHANLRFVIESLRPEIYLAPFIGWYPLYLPEAALANPHLGLSQEDVEEPVAWDACRCLDFSGPRLFWDGYFYNCCSQFTFDAPRLRVGKAGETTLAEAWQRMNRDPVLDVIHRRGVSWLAERAKELGMPIRDTYSSECELCRDLLCNEELMTELEPIARKESQRLRIAELLAPKGSKQA